VTTNLNINFLKKPRPGMLIGECRLMKLGKRLTVGEICIRADGDTDLAAHATSTYSIPPHA
jgi:acyl-coenzyme A thioesterase PaaI-like protein